MTNSEYKKTQSRKWKLVLYVLILAALGVFMPPLLSVWVFGSIEPLVILSGGHFVTLVTLIVSAYFGANIMQKKFLADASVSFEVKAEADTEANTVKANEKGEA